MNVLDLVRQDVGDSNVRKQARGKRGVEWASPCPMCGGTDRFVVFPDQGENGTYFCRLENIGGDMLQYLREVRGLSWKEACELAEHTPIMGYKPLGKQNKRENAQPSFRAHADPAELWQEKARSFVSTAHHHLMAYPSMLDYLAGRGIPLEAVKRCRLGYNPQHEYRPRTSWGLDEIIGDNGKTKRLWLPKGIVIPYWRDGKLQRIKIRQDNDHEFGPRYYMVTGSSSAPMCLNPDARAFVVVEAELDAIACWAAVPDSVGALGMGTLGGKPDEWLHGLLSNSLCILNALDVERIPPKGDTPEAIAEAERKELMQAKQRDWWQITYPHAERWPVPAGKDPGEAFAEGVDLKTWIIAGLPPALTLPVASTPASAMVPAEPPAQAAELPSLHPDVLRLHDVLCAGPMWIEKDAARVALGIKWDWSWRRAAPEHAALCSELSRLVFHTDAAFGWVVAHSASFIDSSNLLRP